MLASNWDILRRFERPSNTGGFERDDPHVGIGMVGAPDRGEVVRLAVRISPTGFIAGARFKAFGGPATIAAASLACELMQGRSTAEAAALSGSELGQRLRFEPSEMRAASLAQAAIHAAIADFRARNQELQ